MSLTPLLRLIAVFFFSLSPAMAESKPPKIYIDNDICPYEGCFYGAWGVQKSADLYDEPHSSKIVGTIKKGDKVTSVTGRVFVTPRRMTVAYPHKTVDGTMLEKDSAVYVLTSAGENDFKVWYKGNIVMDELPFYTTEFLETRCQPATGTCWLTCDAPYLKKEPESGYWRCDLGDSEWWVQIKNESGTVGWVKFTDQFCGFSGSAGPCDE